jgi:4-diphosphocytidyl-2-C-methyl-D-erythritol kinase
LKLKSPAKINLFLHILSKRPDGFHNLRSLFERINLCDEITFKLHRENQITISSNSREIPLDSQNIAYRAALILKKKYKIAQGVHIHIQKNIPVAAGLGGGSSNAATVLLGLNRLWRLKLSKKTLCRLGATLGSDVPFFILETPFALAKGRGEILKEVPARGVKIWHCLVQPPFGISTKEAYAALPLSRLTPPKPDVKMLLHSIQKGHSEALPELLINSLELSLNKRVVTISKIKKELLRCGALGCLLSGSGSCVFGIFASKEKALRAARFLKTQKSWKIFTASTF